MTDPLIQIEKVSLAYQMEYGAPGTLKEYGIRFVKRQMRRQQFWALEDVSLTVGRGEVFGVVGPNGAGKSTLMKVIARVLPPTSGRVIVRGLVAPMISLGAGFSPELTARENVMLFGALLGRDPTYMEERTVEIARWADVEEFLDVPTRNFSTGMVARLAFGTATDVDPDILVVDEILAVGDNAFKKKSKQRIRDMIEGGTSVVLVSHALPSIRNLCSRAMWIDRGHVKMMGTAIDIADAYEAAT